MLRRYADDSELLIEANAADIVEWPVKINSTLQLDSTDASYLRSLVLNTDELGASQNTFIRVLADFEHHMQRVDVEIESESIKHAFAFTNAESQKTHRINTPFRSRWRALLRNNTTTSWSDWQAQEPTAQLLLTASLPPIRSLDISASRLDFINRWAQVIVQFMNDRGEPEGDALVLDAQKRFTTTTRNKRVSSGANVRARFVWLTYAMVRVIANGSVLSPWTALTRPHNGARP